MNFTMVVKKLKKKSRRGGKAKKADEAEAQLLKQNYTDAAE
jgi:hypothetical protein